MATIPAKCESCNYNGGSATPSGPAAPIIPNTNYDFDLDSTSIPDNLLEYFLKALEARNLTTTVVAPFKGKLSKFFEAHRYGDYRLGSLLLAFCLIIEVNSKHRESKDYLVPVVHMLRDHLERSGYACGGSVAVDVFFMEVV